MFLLHKTMIAERRSRYTRQFQPYAIGLTGINFTRYENIYDQCLKLKIYTYLSNHRNVIKIL